MIMITAEQFRNGDVTQRQFFGQFYPEIKNVIDSNFGGQELLDWYNDKAEISNSTWEALYPEVKKLIQKKADRIGMTVSDSTVHRVLTESAKLIVEVWKA